MRTPDQGSLDLSPGVRKVRMGSTWLLPVPGQPGLWASSHGRIWSTRQGRWRKLKPRLQGGRSWDSRGGYLRHTLRDPRDKRKHIPLYVHVAVVLAWKGYPPEDGQVYHVDHINDDHLDNRPENLQWLPAAENVVKRNRRGMTKDEDWEDVI